MGNWFESMAEDDFARARTRELLSRISRLLDPERESLLPLEEVVAILKPSNETYVGMEAVAVDRIVGSEGRYRDFNRHFLPRREFLRSRWVKVDMAHYQDVILPPIRLYEIGGFYFVRDGNHRVSVAMMRGQTMIDAEVTRLDAELALRPGMTLAELKREVIAYEKLRFYERTEYGRISGDQDLDFSSPGRYDTILEHVLVHKYFINQDMEGELGFDEALWSWHENVYGPVVLAIGEEDLLSRFPGRSPSDLYVFIVQHWDELKRKFGLGYPLGEAARDFSERFGSTAVSRAAQAVAGLGRKITGAGRRFLGLEKHSPKEPRR